MLAALPHASVDAVVTDPPYGLEFMGKDWDSFGRETGNGYREKPRWTSDHMGKGFDQLPNHFTAGAPFQRWCELWTAECLRVLKPGGHLLAFGGARTWHRMVVAVEDAGFEIRDSITWLYGSGFPKSLDVSKAIDRAAGATRPVVGFDAARERPNRLYESGAIGNVGGTGRVSDRTDNGATITAPATDAAAQWSGWGTALKPASEPIVVARKPLVGTVAANVQTYGTGALNIDACRTSVTDALYAKNCSGDRGHGDNRTRDMRFGMTAGSANATGRWPANVVLSHAVACADACAPGCPVAELDAQTGTLRSGAPGRHRLGENRGAAYGTESRPPGEPMTGYGDTGTASRFFPTFRYQAKAPSAERPKADGVAHPTVKPLALMRWLVRLVAPPGGIVLEPFAGSGTTVEACLLESVRCVAVERDATYLPLIDARLARARAQLAADAATPQPLALFE